jgi:S1-C subfamily serine protease
MAQPPAVPLPASPSAEDIVDRALHQSVLIEGDGAYGSGIVLVPKRGLILTNWHVVEDMHTPRVTFFDGKSGDAKVVDSDKTLDLALIQGPSIDAAAPEIGDAVDLRAAQPVYAIGSPRKLGFTVTRGIVSYVGRTMEGTRFIQTDLPINEGNSGGPVITARGQVIGIMSFILRRSNGLSFALPINYAIERFAGRLPELSTKHTYLDRFKSWKKK